MLTEDYVSLEIAKLLNTKGFKGEFHKHYWGYEPGKEFLMNGSFNPDYDYPAPTHQMAMKWLREEHNIHINLDVHWLYFANALGWMYTIEKILENGVDYVCSEGDENDKTFYSNYEEACEAAIKYCLEHLIQ